MSRRLGRPCARTSAAVRRQRALAASRDVDPKRFPRLARVLLLPEEAALLKELRDDKERLEFQKIFWARRDPTPGTPENEFAGQRADGVGPLGRSVLVPRSERRRDRLRPGARAAGQAGGGRRQGRDRKEAFEGEVPRSGSNAAAAAAPGSGRQFDNMAYLREGSTREPESWVYRDRPGLPYHSPAPS